MTDLETIRRLSAQEQREPALQLAAQAIRERDAAIALLERAEKVIRGYVKASDDFHYANSGEAERHYERLLESAYGFLHGLPDDIRVFLHQRDR